MKNVGRFGLAIACLAPFLGSPAAAANWIYVTTNGSGTAVYYDAETIYRSGTQVAVWEKWDSARDMSVREREARKRIRYDCAERAFTPLGAILDYPGGKSETYNLSVDEQSRFRGLVAPDTISETILKAVCAATAP